MEEILYKFIGPYIVDNPSMLVLFSFVFILISYTRFRLREYKGWLERHEKEIDRHEDMIIDIIKDMGKKE